MEDYRGVTLMPSLYKVYASFLKERLKEQIQDKEALPPNQTGFRKGMRTDNIWYIGRIMRTDNMRLIIFVC